MIEIAVNWDGVSVNLAAVCGNWAAPEAWSGKADVCVF